MSTRSAGFSGLWKAVSVGGKWRWGGVEGLKEAATAGSEDFEFKELDGCWRDNLA